MNEMKFQTGMRFPCEQNLPEAKWISTDSLDIAFNARVRLKLTAGFSVNFRKNEISFRNAYEFISNFASNVNML